MGKETYLMLKKRILIGLIALVCLALIGFGVVFALQKIKESEQEAILNPPDSPTKKYDITAMAPPENVLDVYDNLAFALQKNIDTVAWLKIPNTDINNVVMQGDDNDFYLRRDENKDHDIFGCYFLDYECGMGGREDFSQNSIIYGHSELTDDKDGRRFAQLYRFLDDDFAKANPYLFLTTPKGEFVFEIFSAFYTDTNFDYIKVHIDEEEKLALAKEAKEISIRDYGIEPALSDKLLTLSTCTVKFDDTDHRFVIMARLLDDTKANEIIEAEREKE